MVATRQQTSHYLDPPVVTTRGLITDSVGDLLLNLLSSLCQSEPQVWEAIARLYLQERLSPAAFDSSAAPALAGTWVADLRRVDQLNKDPNLELGQWRAPALPQYLCDGLRERTDVVELGILLWAQQRPESVTFVANKAGWYKDCGPAPLPSADTDKMNEILTMEDGDERNKLLAQAQEESPLFYEACFANVLFCGV